MTTDAHDALIRDQFTRQAEPFSNARTIADAAALERLVAFSGVGPQDRVLDVACGGGLVVCAFAPRVREAVGVDLTPAMLGRARALAAERALDNVRFEAGDGRRLPFADGHFDCVVTRLSMHHFPDPLHNLREMVRVCAPGGSVVVVDMYTSEDPERAQAFNAMERLRDPSHVRALSLGALRDLFHQAGLGEPRSDFYELRDVLSSLLARSFPDPADVPRIEERFRRSAQDGSLGIPVEVRDGQVHYAYPMVLLGARRPA